MKEIKLKEIIHHAQNKPLERRGNLFRKLSSTKKIVPASPKQTREFFSKQWIDDSIIQRSPALQLKHIQL
jgi:hypothetical protein